MEKVWLKELRGERKQNEIAVECGISQQLYSAIEIGTRQPSVNTAMKIGRVLNFDWTIFFAEAVDELLAAKINIATSVQAKS